MYAFPLLVWAWVCLSLSVSIQGYYQLRRIWLILPPLLTRATVPLLTSFIFISCVVPFLPSSPPCVTTTSFWHTTVFFALRCHHHLFFCPRSRSCVYMCENVYANMYANVSVYVCMLACVCNVSLLFPRPSISLLHSFPFPPFPHPPLCSLLCVFFLLQYLDPMDNSIKEADEGNKSPLVCMVSLGSMV